LGGGLIYGRLGFLWLGLFFLITFLIPKIKRIISCVELEFFLFELFGLESTFDSFHVAKPASEVFFRIEGLDSWLLFILLFIVLRFLFGSFFSLGCGFWLLVV
jgi:hypothetical protein